MSEPIVERAQWGSQLEFIMTMVSYAVGIGNIWRFPYLCYQNGGGAFLIPYVIALTFLGLPLFFMETALGQYAGLGPTKAWRITPLFRGLGWASVTVSSIISMYYNVLIAYMLYYLAASLTSHLPWSTCAQGNGTWAESLCRDTVSGNSSILTNLSSHCVNGVYLKYRTPSEDYYYNYVAQISDGLDEGGTVPWRLLIALFCSWLIVAAVLIKGVQSLGKFVYVTAIFPYIMLTVLLINNCLQPGAIDGIIFYIKPDFSRLKDYKVWVDAASQIFFSLSTCWGGLIAMSSYNQFSNNLYRDTLLTCIINCATSFYGGFAMFSALGTMAYYKNSSVAAVATSGPELAFVTYPAALANMPVAPLWAILFFIMMCLLGLGSQFSNCETVVTVFTDEFPALRSTVKRSTIFRIAVFIFFFLCGIPFICQSGVYLFTLVDDNAGSLPLLVIGLFETIAIGWVYGAKRFRLLITEMIGFTPNFYWIIMWAGISPVLLAVLVVLKFIGMIQKPTTYSGYKFGADCPYQYPEWGKAMAWLIVIAPMVPLVVGFVYQWRKTIKKYPNVTLFQALKLAALPSKGWKSQAARLEEQRKAPELALETVTEEVPPPYGRDLAHQWSVASAKFRELQEEQEKEQAERGEKRHRRKHKKHHRKHRSNKAKEAEADEYSETANGTGNPSFELGETEKH